VRNYLITSIVTPAGSVDLIDAADAKAELKIVDTSDDTLIARFITEASTMAANWCNRSFVVQTYLDQWRVGEWARSHRHWGGARQIKPLPMSNGPVIAISAVDQDATPLTAGTDYEADLSAGLLYRLDGDGNAASWWGDLVTVQYSAGYDTIPADVQAAVFRLVTMRYKGRGRDPMLRERDQGGMVGRETYWIGAPPMDGSLPADIAAMLRPYRVPMVA